MTELLKGYKKDFERRNRWINTNLNIESPFILKEDGDWLEITTPYNHVVMRVKEESEGVVTLNRLNRYTSYLCDNFNQLYMNTCNEMLRMKNFDTPNNLANDLQTMSENDEEYKDGLFISYTNGSSIIIVSTINDCSLCFDQNEKGINWECLHNGKTPLFFGLTNINEAYISIKEIIKHYR